MKAIFLITGTAVLLAIGTTLIGTNNSCCEGAECPPTCCVDKTECCESACPIPSCCK